MKKKGFTLIELLAVIVILAIIALIATPLVLKYIEKSRSESKVDSAYSFVRNLENEIANYSIKNKGAKFNKAPISGDYYKFDDFTKDNGIDTTVKGDKPTDIKVCLSSLGQVEKAMFKYGKYYVSYDGKKGGISDEDSYNNFSCKAVAGGGNDVGDLVLTSTVSIVNNGDSFAGQVILGDGQNIEIKKGNNYCVNLIKQTTGEKIISNHCMSAFMDSMATGYTDVGDAQYLLAFEDNVLVVAFWLPIEEIDYQIEIFEDKANFIPYSFRIDTNGRWTTHSINFVEGDANIKIFDDQNRTYFDGQIDFVDSSFGFIGSDSYDTYSADGLYSAIANGANITVEVTQTVDGKDVVTTITNENITFVNGDKDYYVFGNVNMKHDY